MEMIASAPITFDSPRMLAIAAGIFAIAAAGALARRIALRRKPLILILIGGCCAALAAGSPIWLSPVHSRVRVMVDVSPSTRGAAYRQTAALRNRIAQLLGDNPFEITTFPGDAPVAGRAILADFDVEQTHFNPPPGDQAIVLFSDARFDPPPATMPFTPIYCVIDPNLDDPDDAAVSRLERRDDASEVAASIHNGDGARTARFSGATTRSVPVGSGDSVLTAHLAPRRGREEGAARELSVQLEPARDRWRENDSLVIRIPPAQAPQRWWIGDSAPPAQWTAIEPAQLPIDAAEYLAPAVIALDDVSADRLSPAQQFRLMQYVRDLGGGLLILGGAHAYGAGGYPGTALEVLSPLASDPPEPATRWILLADASGSMSSAIGERTRFSFAAGAMAAVIPYLPPDDPVNLGSFANSLRWWSQARAARQLDPPPAPPDDLRPQGPTDLEPALRTIARAGADAAASADAGNASIPTELLLITDGEADIHDPSSLATALKRSHIRLHLLGITNIASVNPVRMLVEQTGGTYLGEPDPRQWITALRRLMRSAAPPRLVHAPMTVRFVDAAAAIPPAGIPLLNHTWLKSRATSLATAQFRDEKLPAAAKWNFGAGAVVATAFPTGARTAQALSAEVARPPRDPRLKVVWDTGRTLRVSIDAVDGAKVLNDLKFRLDLFPADMTPATNTAATSPASPTTFDIPQSAPGRYELPVPAPRAPSLALVRFQNRIIDRFAVAGRYAPEFDAIGNDRAAMKRLAEATGGAVVEPSQTAPLDLRRPRRWRPLRAWLALLGAGLILGGLICWRRR
jgi:hypothetical protein